jgi:hypothetical protein
MRASRGKVTKLRHLDSYLERPDTVGGRSRMPRHAAIVRYRFAVPVGAEGTIRARRGRANVGSSVGARSAPVGELLDVSARVADEGGR